VRAAAFAAMVLPLATAEAAWAMPLDLGRAGALSRSAGAVYPTVSDQKTLVADLTIDPELRSIALLQAARYASECRVFAPLYRQVTLVGLGNVTDEQRASGYNDVRAAWRDYLRRLNKGRGVVLIGHSQGANRLTELVTREIDPKPALRKRLISAVLLGGDVLVKEGKDSGGDFMHMKACRSHHQVGCVVAFSTFNAPTPADASYGRSPEPGLEVLCTNPAALGGGSGKVTPIYPTKPFAPETTMGALMLAVGRPRQNVPLPGPHIPGATRRTARRRVARTSSRSPASAAPRS
jgi:hypothetical protein